MNFLDAVAAMRQGKKVESKSAGVTLGSGGLLTEAGIELIDATDWEIVPEPEKKVWRRQYILVNKMGGTPFSTSDWVLNERQALKNFDSCRIIGIAAEREFEE